MKTAILLFAALCAQAMAQDPAPAATDWRADVEKACTHPRYGLRLAAARKVAEAGDAAVPAVRAFQQEKGRDAVPAMLVEAFAERGGNGEAVLALLRDWAGDREFFWRGQAMLGLARRARADEPIGKAHAQLFHDHLRDPAWLVRTHAAFGWQKTHRFVEPTPGAVPQEPDPDPRARTRLAALMLGDGDAFLIAELLHALHDQRTFLGDPWGERRAMEAYQALRAHFGERFAPQAGMTPAQALPAMANLAYGDPLRLPLPSALDLAMAERIPADGGIEVLSCQNGDLFVGWTADGTVRFGLERPTEARLPVEPFRAWLGRGAGIANDPQQGVVICDKLRLRSGPPGPELHFVAAPHALPVATADWLKDLAALIETSGKGTLADELRARLRQFAPASEGK